MTIILNALSTGLVRFQGMEKKHTGNVFITHIFFYRIESIDFRDY